MSDTCDLRAANGEPDALCESEDCPFWRVVEQIGRTDETPVNACAIKHFQLLGDDEVAGWLLSVKERIERSEGDR